MREIEYLMPDGKVDCVEAHEKAQALVARLEG